jgi:hypothetical protein
MRLAGTFFRLLGFRKARRLDGGTGEAIGNVAIALIAA